MAEKINGTADWAPGTLDKTRKNIGEISDKDAADMAKKLGGQVLYERTTGSSGSSWPRFRDPKLRKLRTGGCLPADTRENQTAVSAEP